MDFLRLPGALRRSILSYKPVQLYLRGLTTSTHQSTISKQPPLFSDDFDIDLSSQTLSNILRLSSETLNSYTTSYPPNPQQLKYASAFFAAQEPFFLYSAAHFRSFPPSAHPEVAFLGRSNVGKSSLLNALFGRPNQPAAHVSKRPGRTRTMNGYGVRGSLPLGAAPKEAEHEAAWKRFPRGGVVVVDMPGYGAGSQEQWGKEVLKYLANRKQLRCSFVLVDAEHGLKNSDIEILTHLRKNGIAHQVVLSKVDKLLYKGSKHPSVETLSTRLMKLSDVRAGVRKRLNENAGDGREGLGDVLCCSAEKAIGSKHRRLGVDEVRWAVMRACGVESDESGEKKKFDLHGLKVLEENEE